MSEMDKAKALSLLGLAPGASKTQVEGAHKRVRAFWDTDGSGSESLKPLCELMRKEVDSARAIIIQDLATDSSTTSGGKTKEPEKVSQKKGGSVLWLVGIALAGVVLYQASHRDSAGPSSPVIPPTDTYNPPQSQQSQTSSGNDQPPPFVVPFIHADDLSGRATRWTSGWENVNGGQRMVVWGYSANNDPVYKFELYQDGSTWREQRQYEIRYSPDRLQVDVQRFQEQGGAAVMKNQSNVSSAGDVLVQTTIYKFSPQGKLDTVQVDTPFATAKDGLRISRTGGQPYVERVPQGGSVQVGAWLNNLFDLWSVFGDPNI